MKTEQSLPIKQENLDSLHLSKLKQTEEHSEHQHSKLKQPLDLNQTSSINTTTNIKIESNSDRDLDLATKPKDSGSNTLLSSNVKPSNSDSKHLSDLTKSKPNISSSNQSSTPDTVSYSSSSSSSKPESSKSSTSCSTTQSSTSSTTSASTKLHNKHISDRHESSERRKHSSSTSSSDHHHRHRHHEKSSSKHKHSSSSKRMVNTGVQCDSIVENATSLSIASGLNQQISSQSDVESSSTLPQPSSTPSIATSIEKPKGCRRMYGMMGANPMTNVDDQGYKYGHLMFVER